jgi:hypothetical protein
MCVPRRTGTRDIDIAQVDGSYSGTTQQFLGLCLTDAVHSQLILSYELYDPLLKLALTGWHGETKLSTQWFCAWYLNVFPSYTCAQYVFLVACYIDMNHT